MAAIRLSNFSCLRGRLRFPGSFSFLASRAVFIANYSSKPDTGIGDYPQLPWQSAQKLKPRGWWDDQDRRNKETPLHEEDDALNMWVWDATENNGKYTKYEALGQLLIMFGLLGGLYFLSYLYDAPSRNPAVPKEYPFDNLYLERGGDPNVSPTEEDKKERIHVKYL